LVEEQEVEGHELYYVAGTNYFLINKKGEIRNCSSRGRVEREENTCGLQTQCSHQLGLALTSKTSTAYQFCQQQNAT
jgi:hypothetical protein